MADDSDHDKEEGCKSRDDFIDPRSPGRRWFDKLSLLHNEHNALRREHNSLEKRVDMVATDVHHIRELIHNNHVEAMGGITQVRQDQTKILGYIEKEVQFSYGKAMLWAVAFMMLLLILLGTWMRL